MPPEGQTPPSFKIRWNEVTWYSKLGAIILFLGVVPALSFYIGTQYQIAISSQIIQPRSLVNLSNVQTPHPSLKKISFTDIKEGAYSFEGPKIEVLYQSRDFVRNTISFEYGGIAYQILSSDVSPVGKQAPTLFAHKIQYLDPSSKAWTDLTGQSELGDGFTENTGFTVVAYIDSLFLISNARQGFHYNELLGISNRSINSYKKIKDQNIMGIIAGDQGIYLQVDDSLCSDPGMKTYTATCPRYYEFESGGNVVPANVQLPDPFWQMQG